MQLLIDKNEVNPLRYACALHELRYAVMPSQTQGMLEVTVKTKGGHEITPIEGYYLGRAVIQAIEIENLRRSLPDITENNILLLVEDLP